MKIVEIIRKWVLLEIFICTMFFTSFMLWGFPDDVFDRTLFGLVFTAQVLLCLSAPSLIFLIRLEVLFFHKNSSKN